MRALELPKGATCLNIGSSTGEFRSKSQPHIDELLVRPMERAGIRIVHCDMKAADGVDEVGDLFDPEFRERLRNYRADIMVCSNLLEHLTDPAEFARACGQLVRPGGYGLFTVPYSYPYHPDPIDTMLRLSAAELQQLLPAWHVVRAEEIVAGSYSADLTKSGGGLKRFTKHLVRVLLPFYRPRQWKPLAHRLLWLFRPYRQSMVLLQKPVDHVDTGAGADSKG